MSENTKAMQNALINTFHLDKIIEKSSELLARHSANMETLSLVLNTEQFEMLMISLEEAKCGKIVSLKEAFEDLN